MPVLRIPAALEKRLSDLFPKVREREKFVTQILEEALAGKEVEEERPEFIGGTLHLFSDGGSRGNPGQAAIAAILEDPVHGKVLKEFKDRIGIETNNVAEYRALIEGLKIAKHYQPNRLICHLDSELIVRQLNGQYQVKMPTLKPYYDEINELVSEMPDVVFTHIPREDNYRADALVNQALDEMPEPHNKPRIAPRQPTLFPETPKKNQRPGDLYREANKPFRGY
ncbi:MAG TPA: ribonuclease HI family protein [Candidatus Peribacteraceae bacterium]|nr:ribonuclease HI family protein [Candidatus Peribacteraceae bacterium]